jgi:hypothetical protein
MTAQLDRDPADSTQQLQKTVTRRTTSPLSCPSVLFRLTAIFGLAARGGLDAAAESRRHLGNHAGPIARRLLTEEACGRVERAALPAVEPAPVRRDLEQDPHRPPERTGEMRNRGVDRQHQIERRHHRRGIDECVGAGIKVGAQRLDTIAKRGVPKLFAPLPLLQADEADARTE